MSLFKFSIDIGYKLVPIGITLAVLSLLLAVINDLAYITLTITNQHDTFIGNISLKISRFLWGAIAPFTCISVMGIICCFCKILIEMGYYNG